MTCRRRAFDYTCAISSTASRSAGAGRPLCGLAVVGADVRQYEVLVEDEPTTVVPNRRVTSGTVDMAECLNYQGGGSYQRLRR